MTTAEDIVLNLKNGGQLSFDNRFNDTLTLFSDNLLKLRLQSVKKLMKTVLEKAPLRHNIKFQKE